MPINVLFKVFLEFFLAKLTSTRFKGGNYGLSVIVKGCDVVSLRDRFVRRGI